VGEISQKVNFSEIQRPGIGGSNPPKFFVGEIFSKSQVLSQILLVLWEKFSQKVICLVKFFLFRGRNFSKSKLF